MMYDIGVVNKPINFINFINYINFNASQYSKK